MLVHMATPLYAVPPPGGTQAVPDGGTSATVGGTARYSVPRAARLLGISERAVRKRITTGALPAEKTAVGWIVELGAIPAAVLTEPHAVAVPPQAVPDAV